MTSFCYIASLLMLLVEFGNFGYSVWVLRVKLGATVPCASPPEQQPPPRAELVAALDCSSS